MLEILSAILDFLPIPELLRFARVSKRMREMVFDDTRWVQRLQLMGCWDEREARRKAEVLKADICDVQTSLRQENVRNAATGSNVSFDMASGVGKPGRSGTTIFDATEGSGVHEQSNGPGLTPRQARVDDGFDLVALVTTGEKSIYPGERSVTGLTVFSQVHSIRGRARREFAKIYRVLAPLYINAVKCRNHTDATVFRTYRDPDQQAQMLANLSRFSNNDASQGWKQRVDSFNALMGAFENAVFREFEQGLDVGDYQGKVQKYARVLMSLNGGQKGVELFISRNPVIHKKDRLGIPISSLNQNVSGGSLVEHSFRFFSDLSTAFNEQVTIIDQVFPASVNAIVPFLRRTGKEVVSEYVTTLFDEAHRKNIEIYLKAVSAIYEQSLNFAATLRPGRDSGDDFYETVDEIIADAFEPHIDLYLNEELGFFKNKSDAEVGSWERQLSEQDASMRSMYMSNVNRQADKRDFLTSFKKVVMMPVNVLPAFPISSPFGGKTATANALVNGESLETSQSATSQPSTRPSTPAIINGTAFSNRSSTPIPEPPTTELAAKAAIMNSRLEGIRSLFSIEVALNLVHAAKSSIERAAVFVKAGGHFGRDARHQCELVFVLLLQTLGTRHIKAGFDQAVDHLSNYNPRESSEHGGSGVTPLVTFLELVNVGDLIQQMLDVFFEQELIATKLTDRNDFLDPAVKEKKRFEQVLDERVAAGLNKGIEVLMAEVEYVCATTQKPEDFNPGSTGRSRPDVMDISPSQAAKQVVEVVSSHTKMLVGSTDKNMLDVFNQEVGLRLFTVLCKHLKRQRISVDGAIVLIRFVAFVLSFPFFLSKFAFLLPHADSHHLYPFSIHSDMNHYSSYIATLRNADLALFFAALRELAQIYLVDGRAHAKELATIIADGNRFRGIFRAEEVYEFAQRRADWYLVKNGVERAMYGIGCKLM